MRTSWAALAAIVPASSAGAATVFTSQAAFDAAGSGPVRTEDFNSVSEFRGNGFTVGDYSFSGNVVLYPGGTLVPQAGPPNGTSLIYYRLGITAPSATVTSALPFRLLGFDARGFLADVGEPVTFVTDTGESGSFAVPANAGAPFLGFLFDAATTSITFSAFDPDGSYFGTDNYRAYAAAAVDRAVPEPGAWCLMLVGFGAVGTAMRRRRQVRTGLA